MEKISLLLENTPIVLRCCSILNHVKDKTIILLKQNTQTQFEVIMTPKSFAVNK